MDLGKVLVENPFLLALTNRFESDGYESAFVICKVPETLGELQVTEFPDGIVGSLMKTQCQRILGSLKVDEQHQQQQQLWFAIDVPALSAVAPLDPHAWMGDHEDAAVVVVATGVDSILKYIDDGGILELVVTNDGVVLHRSPNVTDEDLANGIIIGC